MPTQSCRGCPLVHTTPTHIPLRLLTLLLLLLNKNKEEGSHEMSKRKTISPTAAVLVDPEAEADAPSRKRGRHLPEGKAAFSLWDHLSAPMGARVLSFLNIVQRHAVVARLSAGLAERVRDPRLAPAQMADTIFLLHRGLTDSRVPLTRVHTLGIFPLLARLRSVDKTPFLAGLAASTSVRHLVVAHRGTEVGGVPADGAVWRAAADYLSAVLGLCAATLERLTITADACRAWYDGRGRHMSVESSAGIGRLQRVLSPEALPALREVRLSILVAPDRLRTTITFLGILEHLRRKWPASGERALRLDVSLLAGETRALPMFPVAPVERSSSFWASLSGFRYALDMADPRASATKGATASALAGVTYTPQSLSDAVLPAATRLEHFALSAEFDAETQRAIIRALEGARTRSLRYLYLQRAASWSGRPPVQPAPMPLSLQRLQAEASEGKNAEVESFLYMRRAEIQWREDRVFLWDPHTMEHFTRALLRHPTLEVVSLGNFPISGRITALLRGLPALRELSSGDTLLEEPHDALLEADLRAAAALIRMQRAPQLRVLSLGILLLRKDPRAPKAVAFSVVGTWHMSSDDLGPRQQLSSDALLVARYREAPRRVEGIVSAMSTLARSCASHGVSMRHSEFRLAVFSPHSEVESAPLPMHRPYGGEERALLHTYEEPAADGL